MPLLLAVPFYLARLITLGKIAQTRIAYGQVAAALSWFVNAYQEIARWRANIERLAAFAEMMDATQRELATAGIRLEPSPDQALRLRDLDVEMPRGRRLLANLNASLAPGESVAVTGPSGSGKTMLMRAIAGVWPFGAGSIQVPTGARTLFLPQWPYLPIGTLRAAASFPAPEGSFPDETVREVLRPARPRASGGAPRRGGASGSSSSRPTSSSAWPWRASSSTSPSGCSSTRRPRRSTRRWSDASTA